MKRLSNFLIIAFAALFLAVGFAACGGNGGCGTGGGDKPSGEHTHTFIETVIEPTCTEKGYTIHKCACGEKYEDSYVSALDHKLGEWKVTTPATEGKDGEEKRICTRENCDYFETRKIPKLDHTHEYTETIVEPTCTEKGYTLHKCECGDEYKDNETEALGHLFGEWETITPATEDSEGLEQRVCARKNCGFKEERAIPVLSHTHHYITTIVEPTCTERGYTKYTCEKCGNSYNADYEKALGHNFGEWKEIKPATEEEDGLKERTCARCGETEEQAIPAKTHEHKFVDTVIEPTCTEKGYTIHKCKCGEQYEDSYVSALDHSFTNYVSDGNATCTKDGTKTAKCDRCDETKTIADEGSAKGHKPSDYISDKEPTCTEAGSKHKECTVCGETLETVEVPAKGHDYSTEWAVDKEATCQKTGIKSHHCTRCDAKTDETEIPLADHNYVDGVCTVCGNEELAEATGLEYTLSADKSYYIVSDLGEETRTRFIIPATYNGMPVKEIDEMAFYQKKNIIQVVLPDSIEKIGISAFYQCSDLKEISFGSSLIMIGGNAFYECGKLSSTTIPDSVTSIGDYAFYKCRSLTDLTIGNSVTSIGDRAFYTCRSLTSITIPDSVTSIGEGAFGVCLSLTNLTIGNGMTSIGESAFDGCRSLTSITIPDSVTSLGKYAFSGCGDGLIKYFKGVGYVDKWAVSCDDAVTKVDLKADTIGIAEMAFSGCGLLTSVIISNGVTSIGEGAFYYCSSLASITVPDSVTNIGDEAFSGCSSLTSIKIPDGVTSIGKGAFSYCSSLTSITIPDSVTSIGEAAFNSCPIEEATVPAIACQYLPRTIKIITITSGDLPKAALHSLNGLTSVTIGDGVTSMGEQVCFYLQSLEKVVIGNGITSIEEESFFGCASLKSVTIGKNVTYIATGAFMGCRALTDINYNGTKDEWQKITKVASWYTSTTGNFTVHCTDGDLTKDEA